MPSSERPEVDRGVPRFKLLTLEYWSLVLGVLAPLVPITVYSYVVARKIVGQDGLVPPAYGVVIALMLGVPPMLLFGGILSYVLRRPHSPRARFLLGCVLGVALFIIGQTDLVRC